MDSICLDFSELGVSFGLDSIAGKTVMKTKNQKKKNV